MIKKVLFIGALLVPRLAYGADPSAPLSVEVVPAESAPAVPAAARAAGFTTLAANYDFSTSFYATQSNWLSCARDNTTRQWYQGFWFNGSNETPCADSIKQSFDAVAGTNVLDLKWDPAYGTVVGGFQGVTVITTQKPNQSTATSFPNAYYEFEARASSLHNGLSLAGWSSSHVAGNGDLEWDTFEIFAGTGNPGYNAAIHNWGNNDNGTNIIWNNSNLPNGFDPRQYHKYGLRITSNGSTMSGCAYVDDVFIRCVNPQAVGRELTLRNYMILSIGNTYAIMNQVDGYFKHLRIWSCVDWETTMCNGTVLTGAP